MKPRFAALLIALLAVAAVAPLGSASSQPDPLCPVCGDGFEDAAGEHGYELTVTETTTTIAVDQDGDATWTVRNRVANDRALNRLRNDSALLDHMAFEALDSSNSPLSNRAWNAEASVGEDGVVTVRFRMRDAATRTPGGVLRVDYLNTGTGISKKIEENDTLRITGPEGYAVTHAPAESRIVDGTAQWTGSEYFGSHESVTLAPADGTATTLWTNLSLALWTGGVVFDNLGQLFPALLLFGVLLSAVVAGGKFTDRRLRRSMGKREVAALALALLFVLSLSSWLVRVATVIAIVVGALLVPLRNRTPTVDNAAAALLVFGVAAIVYPIYDSPSQFTGPLLPSVHFSVVGVGLLYLLTGVLARGTRFFEERMGRFERLFVPLAVVPAMSLVLFLSTVTSSASGTVTVVERLLYAFEGALLALPVGLFLPIGFLSHGESERETAALAVGIFAAYLLHVSLSVGITTPLVGMGAGLEPPLMGLLGLAIIAFGLPLYFLGRALAVSSKGDGHAERL